MRIRGWTRAGDPRARRAAAGLAAVTLALAGCGVSGRGAMTTTTRPAEPTSTAPTSPTTEAPPGSTTEPESTTVTTPVDTTPSTVVVDPGPERPSLGPEELAVAFVRAALTGADLSPYLVDTTVADDAAALEVGAEAGSWDVSVDPEYVDPDGQGGAPGGCQLVGDVTLLCPVLVGRPPVAGGDPSFTLYAVYVTNIDPSATSPNDPLPPVPYYVAGIEVLAG